MALYTPGRSARVRAQWLLCFGLALSSFPLSAQQEVARIPFVDAPPGTAGLGGGLRLGTSPYQADGDDQILDLVPLYLFEGKRFFAHGTSGGVYLFRNDAFTAGLVMRYRFLHLDPDDDDAFDGLEERRQTLDGGLTLSYGGRWGTVRAQWVTDLLDRHDGEQLDLSYRYRYDRGRWSFSPYIQYSWWSSDLTDYYFGVSAAEARPGRPAYTPGKAFNIGFGLNTSYQATDRILIFGNIGSEGYDSSIKDSPIVEEQMVSAAFIGSSYMFGNIERATGAGPEREYEWSWRVNYGYQAEGNIVGEIDQGDFSSSNVATTNIGGITVSKLLTDGPRVDYVGRLALFRHFEEPLQDDFFSYNAYIMAMGKGYAPWSERAIFRWGFGFGFSYAATVPIAEQRKQARRDRNTAHFLNYLEMTVDFPIDGIIKSKVVKNCYAGVTVVHRSGIFSTSDLLGDVSGGSDWITGHLECVR